MSRCESKVIKWCHKLLDKRRTNRELPAREIPLTKLKTLQIDHFTLYSGVPWNQAKSGPSAAREPTRPACARVRVRGVSLSRACARARVYARTGVHARDACACACVHHAMRTLVSWAMFKRGIRALCNWQVACFVMCTLQHSVPKPTHSAKANTRSGSTSREFDCI